jgi:xanthine dehydrogenase YagS FAD-binding subunit
MQAFEYIRAESVAHALATARGGGRFLAGGTNLLDLMKSGVEAPSRIVDVTRLPLARIEEIPDGGLRIGALVRNSDCARDPRVQERYRLLADAIEAGASAQVRNAATMGGNLLQRTRCHYFVDVGFTACNKRVPGSGCGALEGHNRIHAILGASAHCVAVHPSDMAVALAALDAQVVVQGSASERRFDVLDLLRLPGDAPEHDHTLARDELITAIELPPPRFGARACYLKVRDRASFAFALISVAAAIRVEAGTIRDVRIVLGGVAHRPWRAEHAEAALRGAAVAPETFEHAAEAALTGATPLRHNAFKIPLAKRAIVRALSAAASS